MIKRKLRPLAIPSIYILAIVLFVFSLYLMNNLIKKAVLEDNNNNYVDDSIMNTTNDSVPVVATDTTIIRPYISTNVSLFKSFYNSEAEEDKQEESLYFYENTYIQNSGSDYKALEIFDVVSILDGTVTKVTENEILGTTVEIRHSNDLISIYQSLSEVTVKENDTVLQGQIIAKSGKCNLNPDVDNGLHFELSYQGMLVNPEEYFDKALRDL